LPCDLGLGLVNSMPCDVGLGLLCAKWMDGWMGVSQTLGLKIDPSHVQTTFLNG